MVRINLLGATIIGVIYGLIDPRDGCLRYVGETGDLKKRMQAHLRPSMRRANTHKINWLNQLIADGFQPVVIIIEKIYGTLKDLEDAEIRYIAFYRSQGCKLTNGTIGGDGCRGHVHTPETRKKMSDTGKKRYSDPDEVIGNSRNQGGRAVVDQHGTVYQTYKEAARALGVGSCDISRCVRGERAIVHDRSFRFLDESPDILEERLKTTRPRRHDAPFADQYGAIYQTKVEAARKHGFHWASVGACLRGKQNDVQGVKFRYLEEPKYVEEARTLLDKRPGKNKPFVDQNGRIYQTQEEAARLLGVSDSLIGHCLKGRNQHVRGYIFKFLSKTESIAHKDKE